MSQFMVLSIAKGPLEQGGSYSKVWVQPLEWEDRAAPHLTRGPVPFNIGADIAAVDFLATQPLPGVFELDVQVRVASGNKSQAHVVKAEPVKPVLNRPGEKTGN